MSEKLNGIPPIRSTNVQKNKRVTYDMIENDNFRSRQKGLYKIIHEIQIDNDYVKTVFDVQELIDGYVPVFITVIERRDYIVRAENHCRRSLTFSTMAVNLEQKIPLISTGKKTGK